MVKKILVTGVFSSFLIANAYAIPGIDVSMGVGYSSLSPSGYMSYTKGKPTDSDKIDLENDLNLGNSKKMHAYLDIDLPVLPNLKIEYAPFQYTGIGEVSTLKFGDLNILSLSGKTTIETDLNFDQYDLVLYYSLPVPVVSPRLGVAVKYLDGYVSITDKANDDTEKADLNVPIPMLYGGLTIGIPLIPLVSNIDLDLEGKYLSISGHTVSELKALGKVKLLKVPVVGSLYAGIGYKYTRLKIKDLDINDKKFNADFKFKGIIGEIGVEF